MNSGVKNQSIVYALDFDGVICDSAVETGVAGWKCAASLWSDMPSLLPAQPLIDQFRQVRAGLETGYEAILIMRLLFLGRTVTDLMQHYQAELAQTLTESGHDIPYLKQLFGQVRDEWIATSLQEWIHMNPLFPGVKEKLSNLSKTNTWYIVTTKQERFVEQILSANNITLPQENIFGLDRKMSKAAVLIELQSKHPENLIYFVEDRLATLINVMNNETLNSIKLFLAEWGYNTTNDKAVASKLPLVNIALENFLTI